MVGLRRTQSSRLAHPTLMSMIICFNTMVTTHIVFFAKWTCRFAIGKVVGVSRDIPQSPRLITGIRALHFDLPIQQVDIGTADIYLCRS